MTLVLFTGSRDWDHWGAVNRTLYQLHDVLGDFKGLHGGARGLDRMVDHVMKYYGWEVESVLPDWKKFGKRAGMLRNTEMLERRPDYVVAFWDGFSRGTLDTISKAVEVYRIPTMVITI